MKKTYRDPVTGDVLSLGEHLSWIIQSVIRRWSFLAILTIMTILVWSTNNTMALTWWNLCASYLAIVIEGVTAMALINQCRRDAQCLREVRAISQRVEQLAQVLLKDVTIIEEQLHIGEANTSAEVDHPPDQPS